MFKIGVPFNRHWRILEVASYACGDIEKEGLVKEAILTGELEAVQSVGQTRYGRAVNEKNLIDGIEYGVRPLDALVWAKDNVDRLGLSPLAECEEWLAVQVLRTGSDEVLSANLGSREKNNLLRIIGALVELVTGADADEHGQMHNRSKFKTQKALMDALERDYGHLDGISHGNLSSKFSEAKKMMGKHKTRERKDKKPK